MSAFVINPYSFAGEDADAKAYLDAVETADGQALEAGVRKAVDDFVKGCKADDIWSAIKASCILAGARTLAGALTPLVGAAPTNIGGNFVSGDYNRETGLAGDGTTKALNSNRNNNADPQNSSHNSVWITSLGTNVRAYIGCGGGGDTGTNQILYNTNMQTRNRGSAGSFLITGTAVVGLWGHSRSASGSWTHRVNQANSTASYTSSTPYNGDIIVFARGTAASLNFPSNGRIAFYSIGESLDLALLDTRVDTLMDDLAAAIV